MKKVILEVALKEKLMLFNWHSQCDAFSNNMFCTKFSVKVIKYKDAAFHSVSAKPSCQKGFLTCG